ncbi:MAG: prolipoprotein diacylglyceryl transferase [Gammaproteobacteria bacterium]|nr:MAG: prolipoprotein diacylglyceryl transferase [Gammaproteobacteria bacterium]
MLTYPQIDPVLVQIGPLKIHWYGVMYLIGFVAALWLGTYRAKASQGRWRPAEVSDLMYYGFIGVIVGGRVGYVLFYHLDLFIANPLYLFKIWEGGMSFHGGLLGVIGALWYFAKRTGRSFLTVGDFVAPLVPIGLGAGRIGNFINGELWGRPVSADFPLAMVFPRDPLQLPRHPSQLYEFLLEGVVLFVVLWWFSSRPRPTGLVSAMFLLGYGIFRFTVEFFREPDAHLGTIISWLTMGQLLSLPMVIAGVALAVYAVRRAS